MSLSALADPPSMWDPEHDDTLVCVAVWAETHDVMTFVFEAQTPRRFAYRPGQFMTFEVETFQVETLQVELAGQTLHRCYTLSSSPTRPDRISITVKRSGPVSTWLHQTLRPGVSLKALGPMGDFTCADHPAAKYLFLSAGSGITPLMSMTRAFHDLASAADIAFVHSARTPDDLIFGDELALMARRLGGLKVTTLCEADAPDTAWNGYRGRLDLARLALIAPDFLEREVFVCGPSPYMAAVRDMLAGAGLEATRYHQESFDFAELVAEDPGALDLYPPTAQTTQVETFQVQFTASRRTIACAGDGFVLQAAKAAGMRLPSSCTKGMCGACKSRLVSGTVDMTPAGGIRQREIDQGLILICCAKPTSDLVIER